MSAVILDVVGVRQAYGTGRRAVQVLHEINLQVAAGEVVALSGRSGSGKSTLCHLVAGVARPSDGQVLVLGRAAGDVQDWSAVSFLPQRLCLAAELSVAENVLLPARLRRAGPGNRGVREDLFASLGLAGIASRLCAETSLGEQQRAALARALVLRPALTVLDEPTGHQDDVHVELVLAALRTASDDGTATVVATHDPRVLAVADRVVALRHGRVEPSPPVGQGPLQGSSPGSLSIVSAPSSEAGT